MTTTEKVPQTTDAGDPHTFTWRTVLALIAGGLPLPHTVNVDRDGYLTLHFDDLAAGRSWARCLGVTFDDERHDINGSAMTSGSGVFRGFGLSMYVHEGGHLIGVPLADPAADVEAYVGAPKLPAAAVGDYFRDYGTHAEPLPDGVEGYAVTAPKRWPSLDEIQANHERLNRTGNPDEGGL